ncbi:SatD family protein [Mycolicibacterium sp. F2034L]|uniref:SatD family protein n=1 Tax=Mycolicibacterium sp. F2034L TaxID=2926422 RepID=UPI001FF572F7|nr:SatD family protein [Mycolicibacterium sp. F2034L]MCK0176822.1 SatD family protein [Mycolicibacterium sp. F2034L]
MAGIEPQPSVTATVIGDVVASRRAPDRRALHRALAAALDASGFAFTVGDEFQGTHSSVGAAIDAALTVRLAVAPDVDIRFGIGWGAVTVLDDATGIQDGPGWWAAREAIEWTASAQRQPGLAAVRTSYRRASGTPGPDADAVNAALMCRDHLLGSLDDRSIRILKGLLDKHTKKDIAAAEQVSASAVSQRAGRDGLDLLVLTSAYLRGVR